MSENKIYQSMIGILSDVEAIGKNRNADMGTAGKYKFRGIDDMYNSLHELFVKHKVFIIPEVLDTTLEVQTKEKVWNNQVTKSLQYSTIVKMKFTFVAEDGSSITATGVGHSLDTSDKGTNKAQSSALKYCLMQTFLIPTNDEKDVENDDNKVGTGQKPWANRKEMNVALDLIREGKIEEARKYLSAYQVSKENIEMLKMQIEDYENNDKKIELN